jgi:hypothetical protein
MIISEALIKIELTCGRNAAQPIILGKIAFDLIELAKHKFVAQAVEAFEGQTAQ